MSLNKYLLAEPYLFEECSLSNNGGKYQASASHTKFLQNTPSPNSIVLLDKYPSSAACSIKSIQTAYNPLEYSSKYRLSSHVNPQRLLATQESDLLQPAFSGPQFTAYSQRVFRYRGYLPCFTKNNCEIYPFANIYIDIQRNRNQPFKTIF